jgi:mannan endo-1,4-beta-mannosidase
VSRPRAPGRPHAWLILAVLAAVNGGAIYGAALGHQWHPRLAVTQDSSRLAHSRPAPALPLATHYVGVAVKAPAAPSLSVFTHILGRPPGMVESYAQFGKDFPTARATALARRGILSLIQINPRRVSLAGIATGRYDGYLRRYAGEVRRFRSRVALSFGHEMNGWWYSWGPPRTRPATFVRAWRHIHDVFAAQHVTNVSWVWTVSRDASRRGWPAVRAWWPGAGYVNWVGIDGYFRKPGQSFSYVFGQQLAQIRRFTQAPVLIGETAAGPGPDQARQIQSLVTGVRRQHLLGFVWFDIDAKERWNINADPSAQTALHQALATKPAGLGLPATARKLVKNDRGPHC